MNFMNFFILKLFNTIKANRTVFKDLYVLRTPQYPTPMITCKERSVQQVATACKEQPISQNVTRGHIQTGQEKLLKTIVPSVDLENIATVKSEFNFHAGGWSLWKSLTIKSIFWETVWLNRLDIFPLLFSIQNPYQTPNFRKIIPWIEKFCSWRPIFDFSVIAEVY